MKQYLNLVGDVLYNGEERRDRTGVGTLSLFGAQCGYNLQEGFPLVTTKKVNFSAVVKELLWFLSGSTNINDLGCKIWDEWADDSGNLGPIYGHCWRNWGGVRDQDGSVPSIRTGFDQMDDLIFNLKTQPNSRRHVISAWDVDELPNMRLLPCHIMAQFYVRGNVYLDCQLYQRSADLALGVPFNIASYSLLTHLISMDCGYLPGRFIHTFGDVHIYKNHVKGLVKQLQRDPYPLPTISINKKDDIFDVREEDIVLNDYQYHPSIKFEVAV